ncbi:MAG: polymerase [Chloroflexota bacterium]|jgi:DNA polymerase-1|nr:polymerase [Chloroflexota bacterium]
MSPPAPAAGTAAEQARAQTGQKLLLVDSHSLIYRAFFALPALTDRKGRLTNAAFGFTSMLLNALPGHDLVAAAFDHPSKTFRHAEYSEYKAQRPKAPDDLVSQFPIVREVVESLNFATYQVEGYEADDIIGALATQAEAMGLKVSILTGDLDALQLVSPNITALTMRRGISELTAYGVDEVRARYGGLGPENMTDIKALKGDTSDNIPGVPGIGDKTAVKLIQDWGSVENMLAHLDEVTPPRIQELLRQNADQLPVSKRLATIVRDVPVTLDPEAIVLKDYDDVAVRTLFEEYDFRTLMPRLPRPVGTNRKTPEDREGSAAGATVAGPAGATQPAFDFDAPATAGVEGVESPLELATEVVTDPARLEALLAAWAEGGIAATVVLDDPQPRRSAIAGIALAPATGAEAAYIPVVAEGREVPTADDLLGVLRRRWEGLDLTSYSLKQVELALGPRGFPPPRGFDVSLASYLCDSRAKTPPVQELAYQWLGRTLQPVSEVLGSGRKAVAPGSVDADTAARLFGPEPAALALLRTHLAPELERQGLVSLYFDVEVPLAPILAEMELAGVALDIGVMSRLSTELGARISEVEAEINTIAGYAINVNSPLQLQKLLFDELGLASGRRTTTGKVSTDSTVLESLREAHAVVPLVLEYRQLSKLKSTYIDALPTLVDPVDGRVHTSFNQTVAATGRLSSSDPNLQNIPIRTELGRRIRRAFIPRTGNVLVSADYSQIELRVLAHLSEDEALVAAFSEGHDIHAVTASAVFNIPLEEVTPDQRRAAKVANFGVLYGLSASGLQRDLGMPLDEAKQFIANYFGRFASVRTYLETIKSEAYRTGYVETVLGRRRYLQDLRAANPMLRSAAERMAINMPFQGSNADIMKIAMVAIRRRMREAAMRSQMVLQVHDELVFDVLPAELDALAPVIKREMRDAYEMRVPLGVDIKVGHNWDEMTPLPVEI